MRAVMPVLMEIDEALRKGYATEEEVIDFLEDRIDSRDEQIRDLNDELATMEAKLEESEEKVNLLTYTSKTLEAEIKELRESNGK